MVAAAAVYTNHRVCGVPAEAQQTLSQSHGDGGAARNFKMCLLFHYFWGFFFVDIWHPLWKYGAVHEKGNTSPTFLGEKSVGDSDSRMDLDQFNSLLDLIDRNWNYNTY